MPSLSVASKVSDPVPIFILRPLCTDFLRHNMFNMNIIGPKNLQFIMITVLCYLDLLKAVTSPIYEIC